MMIFQISFLPRFLKSFEELDPISQKSIRKTIALLSEDPKHPSLRSKKVKGTEFLYEASANMDLRISWEYKNENTILIRNCGHHDKLLKNP